MGLITCVVGEISCAVVSKPGSNKGCPAVQLVMGVATDFGDFHPFSHHADCKFFTKLVILVGSHTCAGNIGAALLTRHSLDIGSRGPSSVFRRVSTAK